MACGFKYLLVTSEGEPPDPAAFFVTAIRNWRIEEEFMLGDGSRFRILDINTDMTDDQLGELHNLGINGVWIVELAE